MISLDFIKEFVKGIVVIAFAGTICYMATMNIVIPGDFLTVSAGVIGTYFGINLLDRRKDSEIKSLKSENAVLTAQAKGTIVLPS